MDPDGNITSYIWTQLSGPSSSTIATTASVSTLVSNLIQGNYIYLLTVTDNSGASATDTVIITVNTAINQPPVANAGPDQIIQLPVDTVFLNGASSSDTDGSIAAYSWNQISGPRTATFSNAANVSTAVAALLQGSYTFRLTVTDNNGGSAFDDITVTVNPMGVLTAVPYGAVWRYNDSVVAAIPNWNTSAFNDASWKTGPAQLGYGDGDEATVVSFGPSSTNKYITTYFRKTVNLFSPSSYANFMLGVKRDDGIAVYVNGTEVFRSNMPTGTIAYNTFASSAASDDGSSIISTTLPNTAFVSGNNLIAVEIHQNAVSSSDISFDLELKANPPGIINLTRGPYLQMGNETAVTIRWRTDAPTDSRFEAGTSLGNYTHSAYNATLTTEHEVRLTGLSADTKYFYRFGSNNQYLQSDADNFFRTAPPATATGKVRLAVFGDCGRNDNNYQTATLNSYRNYVSNDPASIMLLLGDNAYNSGTEAEYTSNFFNVYSGNILKNHVLFPSPGNHDYANSASSQVDHNIPYYSIFTMPTAGECGGVASGTEAFYSYNWGNIHLLSLDSYGYETGSTRLYDTLGPQVTWIKNDLDANTGKWTIAYWHHPPYTMGSHNSDTESELINMRQNFIRILERYGVDLILCGHSHDYERSYLLRGYYGNEASFNAATHAVSSSSAKYDGSTNSCPYSTVSGPVNHGTVYVVSGSAGASGGVQAGYPHNALPFAQNDGGMLFIEVEDNRLDGKFIRKDGVIADKFTIMKDVSASTSISIAAGQTVTLTASWVGTYTWSNGATTRSITVNPGITTSYTCTDGSTACMNEVFTVDVTSQRLSLEDADFAVYPVPVTRGSMLIVQTGTILPVEISLSDAGGRMIKKATVTGIWKPGTEDLSPGVYFIHALKDGKIETRKVVVQ